MLLAHEGPPSLLSLFQGLIKQLFVVIGCLLKQTLSVRQLFL